MSKTLNQLIAAAIGSAEETDSAVTESAEVATLQKTASAVDTDTMEKLAGVLDFIGRRGVENLLVGSEKIAMTKCGSCGKACDAKMAKCAACGASMSKKASAPETNASGHPGGAGSIDTSGAEHGTHHPSLSSNESAINASPTMKEQRVAPALKKTLKHAGGDNNHQKMKKHAGEHDLDQVREELARRVAAAAGRA
jgi:hypothetical protein